MDIPTKDDIPLDTESVPNEADVPLVAERCSVTEAIARRALLATGGDIQWAVELIESGDVSAEPDSDEDA